MGSELGKRKADEVSDRDQEGDNHSPTPQHINKKRKINNNKSKANENISMLYMLDMYNIIFIILYIVY